MIADIQYMTGLVRRLQRELDARGWSWQELSRRSGIAASTFNKWRNHPTVIPDLRTLAVLSAALDIALRELIEACGFPVNESVNYLDRKARARALVTALPELAEWMEEVAALSPENQDAVIAYLETLTRRRR